MWAGPIADLYQFVSRGDDRDKRLGKNLDFRVVHCGGYDEIAGIEHGSRRQHLFAFEEILTARAYVAALCQHETVFDEVVVELYRVFL